jgi:hypothetical protein
MEVRGKERRVDSTFMRERKKELETIIPSNAEQTPLYCK